MHDRKNKRVPTYFIPTLYVLFASFLLGSAFGLFCSLRTDFACAFEEEQRSGLLSVIRSCLVYHAAVVIGGRFSMGPLIVPSVMLVRGFVLTGTVSVLCMTGALSATELWMICGLPAILQLPSLFYIAALTMSMTICRKTGRRSIPNDAVRIRMKRDIVLAIMLLVGCVVVDCITR